MLDTRQNPSPDTFPPAGYYPYCERVVRLNRLADDITELAAHLDAGAFRLLELIREFDENEGWAGPGMRSCAHWLNWKCGMSLGPARERVRVARTLPSLPLISDAFRKGEVSYSKVRAMTRVATPDNEQSLLQVALHGTASHVETQVRLYRKVKRIEALEEENQRHEQRELNWYVDDDGSWVFRGRFTAEQGALILQALEVAEEQLFEEQCGVPENVPAGTSCQKRADALTRVAEGFLAGVDAEASGGDHYLVNIHTGMETLQEGGNGAESEVEDAGNVSAETSRRMACDCSVVHWRDNEEGEPLNIGRKSRTIPPAIRRALKRRDQGCRFPGCTCKRFVDAHHIVHWADGGETSMDNLVLLCRTHHRLVHEGGFGVENTDDRGAVFYMPGGEPIPQVPEKRSRGNVFAIMSGNHKNGLQITPETPIPRWDGEPMDHAEAVAMLM
ncbi:MAG: DUF222 domain-containing protein [Lysobacterales bacterium]|jgi:hypothetical protein